MLTLAGGDAIADGLDTASCLTLGQWGCAFISGAATAIPFAPASLLRNIPGAGWLSAKIDEGLEGLNGVFGCSFSEDTPVLTESGLAPISEVKPGENVLAYNEETGEIGYYPIMAIWVHEDPVIVHLTIDGETIETTAEHPFYTVKGDWLPAAYLQPGDELRQTDWSVGAVEAIQFIAQPQIMYNFTVAIAHTYFVGNGQWLVHNACIQNINPADLHWTQRTAGGRGRAADLRESMVAGGWDGPPIDVVQTSDGLVTVDHTRAVIALELNMESIPARIHLPSDPLPSSMSGRFGSSTTWGEAIAYRAANQRPPLPPTGTTTIPRLPRR
jgi:hypothetical protein